MSNTVHAIIFGGNDGPSSLTRARKPEHSQKRITGKWISPQFRTDRSLPRQMTFIIAVPGDRKGARLECRAVVDRTRRVCSDRDSRDNHGRRQLDPESPYSTQSGCHANIAISPYIGVFAKTARDEIVDI